MEVRQANCAFWLPKVRGFHWMAMHGLARHRYRNIPSLSTGESGLARVPGNATVLCAISLQVFECSATRRMSARCYSPLRQRRSRRGTTAVRKIRVRVRSIAVASVRWNADRSLSRELQKLLLLTTDSAGWMPPKSIHYRLPSESRPQLLTTQAGAGRPLKSAPAPRLSYLTAWRSQ